MLESLLLPAAYVLILSGTANHNGDRIIDIQVADSRTIFFTQSVYRCAPGAHVVCEVRHSLWLTSLVNA